MKQIVLIALSLVSFICAASETLEQAKRTGNIQRLESIKGQMGTKPEGRFAEIYIAYIKDKKSGQINKLRELAQRWRQTTQRWRQTKGKKGKNLEGYINATMREINRLEQEFSALKKAAEAKAQQDAAQQAKLAEEAARKLAGQQVAKAAAEAARKRLAAQRLAADEAEVRRQQAEREAARKKRAAEAKRQQELLAKQQVIATENAALTKAGVVIQDDNLTFLRDIAQLQGRKKGAGLWPLRYTSILTDDAINRLNKKVTELETNFPGRWEDMVRRWSQASTVIMQTKTPNSDDYFAWSEVGRILDRKLPIGG